MHPFLNIKLTKFINWKICMTSLVNHNFIVIIKLTDIWAIPYAYNSYISTYLKNSILTTCHVVKLYLNLQNGDLIL